MAAAHSLLLAHVPVSLPFTPFIDTLRLPENGLGLLLAAIDAIMPLATSCPC